MKGFKADVIHLRRDIFEGILSEGQLTEGLLSDSHQNHSICADVSDGSNTIFTIFRKTASNDTNDINYLVVAEELCIYVVLQKMVPSLLSMFMQLISAY